MANLKIDGRMKVATLKEAFFNEFGGVLRIYDGNKRANDDALLCDIRVNDDVASGEYICRASRTVGKFCEEMMQVFGIKVKVATCDDWVLVLDGITLATIKKIPKQATIEMMKKFLAYQRKDNSSKEEEEEQNSNTSNSQIKEDETGLPEFPIKFFGKVVNAADYKSISFVADDMDKDLLDEMYSQLKENLKGYLDKCVWDEDLDYYYKITIYTSEDLWDNLDSISNNYPEVEFTYDWYERERSVFFKGKGEDCSND